MHGRDITSIFLDALTGPCRVTRGQSMLLCVSGGMDSMVLLDLALKTAPLLDLRLGVIHVDHGLRGKESARDAQFVKNICRRLSVPFHLINLSMDPVTPNLEEEARQRRYKAILDCMKDHGYDCAATGHTQDDQAETVLYRIIRGTGIRGLSGMEHCRDDGIVRPMLDITRNDVRGHARKNDLEYVQDASNTDLRRARNLIRSSILPSMQRINPKVTEAVSSLASIARLEGDALDAMATELTSRAATIDWSAFRAFSLAHVVSAPEAVTRRFVIRIIADMTGEERGMDASEVERVLKVIEGSATAHTVRRKLRVCRDGDLLVFLLTAPRPYYAHPVARGGDLYIPEIRTAVRIVMPKGNHARLTLRSWLPGDRTDSNRVADVLSALKVPGSQRPFWPVLASKTGVLAVGSDRDSSDPCRIVLGGALGA